MHTVFGLDFGTTNSALAVNAQGLTAMIDIDPHNPTEKTMRSVIFMDKEQGVYLGQEAIVQYIEQRGHGRFMQSIKSFLPSAAFEYTYVNGKRYELEDLIALIISTIKQRGEEFVGHEVTDVVMGRPVVFSEDQNKDILAEGRLKRAAEIAGFKHVAFQMEPVAAALTFENSLGKDEEKIVLIGDFGGGTSDFTVIRLTGGKSGQSDRAKDVLSLGGVSIAGDAFDSRLMWEKVAGYFGKNVKYKSMTGQTLDMPSPITFKLINWHLIPQLRTNSVREALSHIKLTADDPTAIGNLENLIEDNNGFLLFQAIEKAKIELSSYERSMIFFREQGLEIKEAVERKEFEEAIHGHIVRIAACIDETVQKAGLKPGDIDVIFTTGGTSHIPCVKDLFVQRFGSEKMQQQEAFTSVAYGLGLSASMFFEAGP
jgi:hypothetical chaperone protein